MMDYKRILNAALCTVMLLIPTYVFSSQQIGFESAEHYTAGENVKLYFDSRDMGQVNYSLHLPNGLSLNYAQLITLSGDYYGVVGQTISEGQSLEERKARFIQAFDSLAVSPASVVEVPELLAVINREHDAIVAGINQGEKPETIYARIGENNNREFNCITGGGCGAQWWLFQGRYLNLAKRDFDHFGNNALLAYAAGHAVALDTAIAAHQSGNRMQLELAYAINAYACHFLSDRFASGHMRTPRPQLPASVTPSVVGSLLASFMHSEENKNGLHVHNARGDNWYAMGDRYYFDSQNATNRKILAETLQESVNQVFSAYQSGSVSSEDHVFDLIPQPNEMGAAINQDISSLFYWDSASNTLYRRSDVTNVNDNHWTSDWWGWTTLIMIARERGIPTGGQSELIAAGYGKEAMQYGLITDKSLVEYMKAVK